MGVTVVPYDPAWAEAFAHEAEVLGRVLGPQLRLHHIGSTAIPGILAKPVLDLLGVVESLGWIDHRNGVVEALGYEAMGAYDIPGRRYFRKDGPDGRRSHHLHVFAEGSPHITRHLAFRDYLRAHPKVARAYSDLKAVLVREAADGEAYADGKDPFVSATEQDALAWHLKQA